MSFTVERVYFGMEDIFVVRLLFSAEGKILLEILVLLFADAVLFAGAAVLFEVLFF